MTVPHRLRRGVAATALLGLALGLGVGLPAAAGAAPATPRAGTPAPARLPSSAPTRSAAGAAAVPAPSAPLAVPSQQVPAAPATTTGESGWEPKDPPLTTPWTADVTPSNALPDYPRPQLARDRWRNLNGVWQFAAARAGQAPPFGTALPERVLVPYPVEAALSGIGRHEDRMFYRRTAQVPKGWGVCGTRPKPGCQRLVLQFGAVDYETTVWVNGTRVGTHRGGYDSFSFDVTDALRGTGPQELVVGVTDPTDAGEQPLGKQRLQPGGIFYTPTSGIWQTVWMEPVSTAHVTRLDLTPDVPGSRVQVAAQVSAPADRLVEVTAYDGSTPVGTVTGPAGRPLSLRIPGAKLWSPSSPFLYELQVRVLQGRARKQVDRVDSYVGMRSITLGTVDGVTRPLLNGQFVFQLGTLDQGYWPDGNLTAPTDEALRWDLEQQKALGFNTVRKHIKVEPARWYYWADRLGMMVWQDMPAMRTGSDPSPTARAVFEDELRAMVDQLRSVPSIVEWTPFNEGWGEYDPARVVKLVQDYDPSRLVDDNSGGNCCGYYGGVGDYLTHHSYPDPTSPSPPPGRAAGLTEFGGLGLRVAGHEWSPGDGFAYEIEPDAAALTRRYVGLLRDTRELCLRCGLSVAIYTQPYDVENEINGLFTYDRRVLKVDAAQTRAANLSVLAAAGEVATPTPPRPGTPGLAGVGEWRLDEGAGTVAHDTSGRGHDGRLLGGPAWVAGHAGSALQFDGVDDEVDTGAGILDTTGDYSASAWVRLDSLGGFATAVSQDGPSHSEFFLQYSGADNRFAFSSVGSRALAPAAPEPGRWYHLVGVRDSVRNTLQLYVDGVPAGTAAYCLGAPAPGPTVIGRGQYGGQPVDRWRGALDEVHVYDRALSPDEVRQLAAA